MSCDVSNIFYFRNDFLLWQMSWLKCSIWSMWDHLEMSLFLNDFRYWSVSQLSGSIPLSWPPVGLTETRPIELKSAVEQTERILYLPPHGNVKKKRNIISICCVLPILQCYMLFQVQVSVSSAVGPSYIFSRSFICNDVSSSCFNGWGMYSIF